VIAQSGHEQLPYRVPHHGRGSIAGRRKRIKRTLHIFAGAVDDGG
jgi:hypothetical protein